MAILAGGNHPSPKPSDADADKVWTPAASRFVKPQESTPMSDAICQPKQQHFANLNVLHRQLEEMASRVKRSGSTKRDQRQVFQEPVLIIRGK